MLQGFPTKNGTGISIYGDYGDLNLLYETIHHFADSLDPDIVRTKAQHKLLMNFAYEVRKGFSGDRLSGEFMFPGDNKKYHRYGFQIVWTDILIFISTLRHNAGYKQSNKVQQAIMYMLEYVVEDALFAYDPEGANVIKNYISQRINILDEFAFIIYQAIHIEFVGRNSGKVRFRNLPNLFNAYFSPESKEYKGMITPFQEAAKAENCEITDLEFSNFPDIKW